MTIACKGRWTIDYDADATALCYAERPIGTGCECNDCKNFMAALDHAFPESFRELANGFGIDISKPIEFCQYCREESGLHYVGGFFHLVGRIVTGADAWRPTSPTSWVPDFLTLPGGVEIGFTNRTALVAGSFATHEIIQLEFTTRVPWVIAEPESV